MFFNQLTGFGKAEGNVRLDDPKIRYIMVVMEKSSRKIDSAMITQNLMR